MAYKIEFTNKQLSDMADMALCLAYHYEREIKKAKARIDRGKLSQNYRDRLCFNIARYQEEVAKYRQMYEYISRQHRQAKAEEAMEVRELKNTICFLSQIHEIMADQGLLPEQYMTGLSIGIRLSEKYRLN